MTDVDTVRAGKLVVITGATGGIGGALATSLIQDETPVLAVGRDTSRLASLKSSGASVLPADLSSPEGCTTVSSAVSQVSELTVVHCAGVWPQHRVLTPQGWELAFAVNHLAPFRINHQIRIQDRQQRVRIVQVGAGLAIRGTIDIARTPTGQDFGAIRTYINTKLWNALATLEWAQRWPAADICSIHPGVVKTDLGARTGPSGWLLNLVKRRWLEPADSIGGIRYLLECEPAERAVFVNTDGREPVAIPHTDMQNDVFDETLAMIDR